MLQLLILGLAGFGILVQVVEHIDGSSLQGRYSGVVDGEALHLDGFVYFALASVNVWSELALA